MIRPSNPPCSFQEGGGTVDLQSKPSASACNVVYGRPFWLAYASGLLGSTAVAILYRYADFVTVLGGTELHLGWIVGIGMTGSLVTRLWLGAGIDRQGPRIVWLGALAAFVLTSLANLAIDRYDGVAIYLVRIAWCCAVAGTFSSSTAFVAMNAPLSRMAELVGMQGTSGFMGMLLGAQVGDLLFHGHPIDRPHVNQMFIWAAVLASCSAVFAWFATQGVQRPRQRRRVPLFRVLKAYQPGVVLLIGVASGIGIGLPQTFLRAYAADLDIGNIGLFFLVYGPAAVGTRIVTRRWSERFGLEPIIFAGTAVMVIGVLLLMTVRSTWQLMIPGLAYGIGHAMLFPVVIAAGGRSFPSRYRGLATTLILAMWDIGLLVGSPIAGVVLHFSERCGLPPYPTMFISVAGLMTALALPYTRTALARWSVRPQPAPAIQVDRLARARNDAAHLPPFVLSPDVGLRTHPPVPAEEVTSS
jgi:MFS family permease